MVSTRTVCEFLSSNHTWPENLKSVAKRKISNRISYTISKCWLDDIMGTSHALGIDKGRLECVITGCCEDPVFKLASEDTM